VAEWVEPSSCLSIITIYLFVERFRLITRASQLDENFMNRIKENVLDGRLDAAKTLCQSNDSPVARMIEKGLTRIGKPLKDISAAIENTGKLEVYRMEQNLATLATISGAAPMIGFLGTVIGMILAFHEMAAAGGQIDVEMLAEGIYTAMTTTVAGLIVGILAYVGYNFLVHRVDKVVYRMEANATEFMDLLNDPGK
jgi:biopolymer transport protein ExbB